MSRLPFSKEGRSPHTATSDSDLIAACLKGNAEAWDALIDRYAALIFSVSLRMGVSHADTEDVFQDVSLILLDHLADVRDTTKFASWIISTTKREALRKRRPGAVTLATEMGEGAWEMESAAGLYGQGQEGNPETEMLALVEQQLMREALTRLPDRCRRLLTLLYAAEEAVSYLELAETLALPVGSIGPTRARCLQNLRKILVELGF